MSYQSLSLFRLALAIAFVVLNVCGHFAHGQILYDGALLTTPGSQGWSFFAAGSATQTLTNDSVLLDTSASLSTQAGYSRIAPSPLNRTNGFTLLFTVQIQAETHSTTNRAGFSIIALGADKRGLELGFWSDRIFAQADSPLFTHAEEAIFPTAASLTNYSLTMLATNYVLRANGVAILSGSVRDYTAFSGFPNPYSTPNFLFIGDDTTSASSAALIRQVILVTAPTVAIQTEGIISWNGVSNQTYTVQASINLTDWVNLAAVTSSTSFFSFTNTPLLPSRFFRVAFP